MLLNIKHFNSSCCLDINHSHDNRNVVNTMIYHFAEIMNVEFRKTKHLQKSEKQKHTM